MDGTTAIKIDYYEELKAKADKYDNAKVIIDFTNGIYYSHEEKSKNFVLPIVKYDDFVKLREKADKWDEEKHLIEIAQAFLKAEENGLFEFGVKDIVEWYRENL